MHYFTRLKIIHSLKLIAKGMSIKDISEKLSFSSPNYYTAVFKREMGILPTKYRQAGKIQQ
jgi:AraC family transcriptional regulator